MIAHIAGVPVEEVLPALVSGIGAGLLLSLTSVASLFRRSRGAAACGTRTVVADRAHARAETDRDQEQR